MNFRSYIAFVLLLFQTVGSAAEAPKNKDKIQIAIILDVSGSMNGLLTQAKGQLWDLVKELSSVEKDGQDVEFEISIISYGYASLDSNDRYTIHTPLSTDVDQIAEHLYKLQANGNIEHCGLVLSKALEELKWSNSKRDAKIIFIAGNESFDQGEHSYVQACKSAQQCGVTINTIFCGPHEQGKLLLWARAASLGKGEYQCIQQDSVVPKSETHWDRKIILYNGLLNSTYMPYGKNGRVMQARQIDQDRNAQAMGNAYLRERVIFKLGKRYMNPTWDLVDRYKQDSLILTSLTFNELPTELQYISRAEQQKLIERRIKQREVYFEAAQIYIEHANRDLSEFDIAKPTQQLMTLSRTMISTVKQQIEIRNMRIH